MRLSRSRDPQAPISGRGRLRERNLPNSFVLRPARGLEKYVREHVLHTVMHENILATAARLSDDALHARLKVFSLRERDATVELVGHLAELDGRQSRLGEGPGNLYAYCRDVLGYSEDAAWNRAATAAAVRRYSVILRWLADGSLNVTTVRMLRPVLTADNHLAVLTEARRRSKREVELIVRRLDPKPDVPSTIRKVAASASTLPPPNATLTLPEDKPAPPPPAAPPLASVPRPMVAPLSPSAIVFSSRSRRKPTTSFSGCRTCLAARSPTAIPRSSSSARSISS